MISIIVPVYKAEKFIERCVNSILNQTYRDLELILVDDGSPDQCPQLCDRFAEADKRVRVIHKKNGGVSTARNAGLEVVRGEYIAFVDSDDFLEPQMYEKMMEKAIAHDCDVVMCDCVKDFKDHSTVYSHDIRGGFYNLDQLKQEHYPHLLIMENVEYPATISNWTLLWKSTLNTTDMRYQSGVRFSEDLLFGAKLLRKAKSFYYMKGEALYHYVMNDASASHTYVPDKWNDYQLLHSRIVAEFGADKEFDFSKQIDLCLLFFLYNTLGETNGADISQKEKKTKMREILRDESVRAMFRRVKVLKLPIATKLKLITLIYKYRVGLALLRVYCRRK
ncbi:MAG: glycosyltransferase [Ruminococcaceae bacterium]|nr:glycosyltransferase [Oscillospiraceae bacterium]